MYLPKNDKERGDILLDSHANDFRFLSILVLSINLYHIMFWLLKALLMFLSCTKHLCPGRKTVNFTENGDN